MRLLACAIALFALQAVAADFSQRVVDAKRASETAQGGTYDAALGPHIGSAIRACVPPGSTDPTNLGSFTLVGNVMASGQIQEIEVQPRTKVSSCFAQHFSQDVLPPPPTSGSPYGYPVVVEMRVEP